MPSQTEPTAAVASPGQKLRKSNGAVSMPGPSELDIIDIRRETVESNIKEEIKSMFHPKIGPRKLPTLLLYSKRGLQLFEDITYLDEYYLTMDEIKVLNQYASEIAGQIPKNAMVIELGSGNLRKVALLLRALEDQAKDVDYFALDLSREELERTLAQVPSFQHVRCHGLLGTYDDGREWLKLPENLARPKCILSLGSSIGNFDRDEAADFLSGFAQALRPFDTMLIGVDACKDAAKVFHAYNDKEGITHEFILQGLVHANEILEEEAFKVKDWRVIGEYVYDEDGGRHQAFLSPRRDTMVLGELIRAHERIQVEQSLKYSREESLKLWNFAGMAEIAKWTRGEEYGLHLLARPKMPFSLTRCLYAQSSLPSLDDWESQWKAWDVVTREMLPGEELLEKPIKLRNACIFYLGHIPTFLDIQLTKVTAAAPVEPKYFHGIFERGIDPDVDNPEFCHAHSEIPDEWPQLDEILNYQRRVRAKVRGLYTAGLETMPRAVARAIWIGFEHELMHIETLLYMMLQSNKTLPPPHAEQPNFAKMAEKARKARVPNQWFTIPAQTITIGLDDPEDGEKPGHFGWDNEKPVRQANVHSFQAQGRPITNEEYAYYMYKTNRSQVPASWATSDEDGRMANMNGATNGHTNGYTNGHTNGIDDSTGPPESFLKGKSVRTVYGLVPLKYALDWPVMASYDELEGCATWMGGRIPTFEEARSIYAYVTAMKDEKAERKLGRTVPAVNAHLSNDGVNQTPPSGTSDVGDEGLSSDKLFIDLDGTNVGFQHWHPLPVTANGGKLAGQSEMGGVWEWTSSTLEKHEGFEPMAIYPGYTADFFDGKHNIVLGGSWATHPRIAGRKSFVNWYQRNYMYAWVGARLVRDTQ